MNRRNFLANLFQWSLGLAAVLFVKDRWFQTAKCADGKRKKGQIQPKENPEAVKRK